MVRWTASLTVVLALLAPPASAQPPPNVLLIVMDDVGYADYGSYGAKDIRTPNIDSLARHGTRFTAPAPH